MPIVNFAINKIEAIKHLEELKGKLSIKSDLKITNVAEEKLDILNQSALKFTFEFVVDYDPKFGKIALGGILLYLPSELEKTTKETVENWKKTKKLEPKLMEMLFNAILTRCNIKALIFSQEVNLPPHLRLPIVVANKEDSNKKDAYIG